MGAREWGEGEIKNYREKKKRKEREERKKKDEMTGKNGGKMQ